MKKTLNLELYEVSQLISKLYHYRKMIGESITYTGRFRKLMESNIRFRIAAKKFNRLLILLLCKRIPAYIYKLFVAFKDFANNGEASKLNNLFSEDPEIFDIYKNNIKLFSDLFVMYQNPKYIAHYYKKMLDNQASIVEMPESDKDEKKVEKKLTRLKL